MKRRLREWRERRLLTQRELAEKVGMSVGQINRIERGVHRPRLSTVRKLTEALSVSADEIIEWEEGEWHQDEMSGNE
ncbi:MAG: helix-turn-helix domain-containing protein [Chloroflexota bacterium]|nr:helix-turn-helix domain-containing protein [Chloroflexota bacterium]